MEAAYPRPIAPIEEMILKVILPAEHEGYRAYFEFASHAEILGEGRWGAGDLILTNSRNGSQTEIDRTKGMRRVIAFGEFALADGRTIAVTCHEPEDDQMEVQFSEDIAQLSPTEIRSSWTYSGWRPGSELAGGITPREIALKNSHGRTEFVLALSQQRRNIWLHHIATGFNQLLPVTGFYEYLLRSKPVAELDRTREAALSPRYFFTHLSEFTDENLRLALIHYNDENRKFDFSGIARHDPRRASWLGRIARVFTGKMNG